MKNETNENTNRLETLYTEESSYKFAGVSVQYADNFDNKGQISNSNFQHACLLHGIYRAMYFMNNLMLLYK